jgi:hypothetical protein
MLRIPFLDRKLWVTGDLLLRAELKLLLFDRHQQWREADFRVDPGAEISMMPAAYAQRLELPMPRLAIPPVDLGTFRGKSAAVIRSGMLKARVAALPDVTLAIPCFFLGEPDINGQTPLPPNLLGLSSIVRQLRLTFDGTPIPNAPYGSLLVETLAPPPSPST